MNAQKNENGYVYLHSHYRVKTNSTLLPHRIYLHSNMASLKSIRRLGNFSSDDESDDDVNTSSGEQKLRRELIEYIVENSEDELREDVEKWSMFYLKRQVKKLQLPRDEYKIVKAYVVYRLEKTVCEGGSDNHSHMLFDISADDAEIFLAEEDIRLREAISVYGQKPSESGDIHIRLRQLWNNKGVMQKHLIDSGISKDEVKKLSDRELVEKHAIYEAEKEAKMEAQRLENEKRPYLRKLFTFSQNYFTEMPGNDTSVEDLKTLLANAEEKARKIEKQRSDSYEKSMSAAMNAVIERKPTFFGVFGTMDFDEEILRVFSVLTLHQMFSSALNVIPSVDDILCDSVKDRRLGEKDELSTLIILFNGMVAGRGRFFCDVTDSSTVPCGISNGNVDLLRVKMFVFVLREMLKNNVTNPNDMRYFEYARMVNEIELYILCSSTALGDTLSVYGDDPRVMTETVKRFAEFVKCDKNPYEKVVTDMDVMREIFKPQRRKICTDPLSDDDCGEGRNGCVHQ